LKNFKLFWIAEQILRSNDKICFSFFVAISCENDVFGPKNVRS
jgi:hypothetical protein